MFFECCDLLVRAGGTEVLAAEQLAVADGQITAIVGPNGAGKTTLLEIMALLRRPDAGTVRLWDAPAAPTDRAVRDTVVMVMHPGYLFRGSVWGNVLYGPKARGASQADARRAATDALQMVCLDGFESRDVSELSAGERQRVNLARAVAAGARALLLDEPAANVDAQTVDVMRDLLGRLCERQGMTIVHTSPGPGPFQGLSHATVELARGRLVQCPPPTSWAG